VSSDQN